MPAIAHQNKILGNGALVDDTTTSADKTWSSSKINTELGLKANSADVPLKTQITNPNLLDNPWFTINQRGQSSYVMTSAGYTIDRFRASMAGGSNVTIGVNTNGIAISSTAGANNIRQSLEYDRFVLGKTYTVSMMLSDGTIISGNFTAPSTIPSETQSFTDIIHNTNIRVDIQFAPTIVYVYIVFLTTNVTTNLRAIKLEVGSISTLAMDTAPNYAIELAKCKASTADSGDTYANQGQILVGSPTFTRFGAFPTETNYKNNEPSGNCYWERLGRLCIVNLAIYVVASIAGNTTVGYTLPIPFNDTYFFGTLTSPDGDALYCGLSNGGDLYFYGGITGKVYTGSFTYLTKD